LAPLAGRSIEGSSEHLTDLTTFKPTVREYTYGQDGKFMTLAAAAAVALVAGLTAASR
jgi:hypothetical protein